MFISGNLVTFWHDEKQIYTAKMMIYPEQMMIYLQENCFFCSKPSNFWCLAVNPGDLEFNDLLSAIGNWEYDIRSGQFLQLNEIQ